MLYTARVPATPPRWWARDFDQVRVGIKAVPLVRRAGVTVNTFVISPSLQTQPQQQPAGAEVLVAVGWALR